MSLDIVLVTCERWPEISTSDALLAEELTRLGHRVRGLPWNAAPLSAFTCADLVVLRSNWDFHHDMGAFTAWLGAVDASDAQLRNSCALVRAHEPKRYLQRYAQAGIATPATLSLDRFEPTSVQAWMAERGFERVVCKPAWGASGHGVSLVHRDEIRDHAARWRSNGERRSVVIQEFVPQISGGEYALVFFGGAYSHALHRMPSNDDFRVNTQYGGTMTAAADLPAAAIDFAEHVVRVFPEAATYARIDIVATDTGFALMEVEVNEPALGLHLAPDAARRFARALTE